MQTPFRFLDSYSQARKERPGVECTAQAEQSLPIGRYVRSTKCVAKGHRASARKVYGRKDKIYAARVSSLGACSKLKRHA